MQLQPWVGLGQAEVGVPLRSLQVGLVLVLVLVLVLGLGLGLGLGVGLGLGYRCGACR